ncbi:YadA-like family protein [[Mannheimia] succiniciproducens]|uniref:Hsf protein n=1 Tax=Mannheimia succiniciproducens (strain KCTC 0769BP / MBEL55E) TaxID=221988 RepID=Q65UK5_MANSM|nr:YadA-like family protein [[Mannheimia] succiniciproducens]AAU37355.1 unknown [[Mannheimia] succiniciproducens MBEL55E]
MNHIYKVVWSKTTNSLVVVSELASSQGKAASVVSKGYKLSSVFKKSFQLTALSALLISVMPAAQAAIAVGASTVTNWNGAVSVSLNGASATGASVPYNYHTPNNENYPDQGNNSNSSNIYSGTLSAAQSIAIGINATSQSGSIALGDNSRATGGLSLALGAFSQTNQAGAIALGTSALASGFNSFATMRQAAATADFAIAMGTAANANATNSIAMGSSALALGNQSIAIGSAAMEKKVGSAGGESYRTDYVGTTNTKAQGDRTIAFGVNTSTTSNDSIAIGSNSKTNSGTGAIAIGWCSSTSYQDSVAIGSNATANGGYSLALGYNATSTNLTSISIGWNAAASNTGGGHSQGAVAIGPKTTALGNQSVVLGASASAVEQATAIGNDSKANGFGSIVIGGDDTGYSRNPNSDPYTPTALGGERIGYLANTATGDNSNYRSSLSSGIGSVVVGVHGQALSNGSTAIGVYSTAGDNGITFTNDTTSTTAIEATAIGALSRAKSIRSSAIGYSAEALGNYSTVVGANSTANGTSSLALGHNSTAYSTYSLAAGYNASANLSNSTAIGSSSNASGLNAIALGTGAQALNTNTISIGTGNIVSGENSGAIGDPNNITGSNSYALGNNNVIYANNSFAVGNSIYISDTAQNTLAFGTNISVPTSTKTNNTLIGTSAKIQGGESSIAFGTNATVSNSVQSSAIAIGNQSKVEAAVGGIAIGNGSTISSSANNGSIALGQKTNVTGVSSIALGNNASVTGTQQGSVAIGNNTNVTNTGQGTVAVGSDTNVTVGNAVAIGDHVNVKGQRSIAIGSSSNVAEGVVNATTIGTGSNVTQNDGTAVGYNAIVSNYNGLALGANATSTAQRAVALGADSVAGREGWDQAAYDPYIPANANTSQSAAITATKATNNYGAVSVGSDTVKRQIINVAAGSADSDAVNVAQLKAAIGSVNTSWNIQENGTQKDIVNAGDNVSFANGTGTTANVSVDSTGKTSTVKYSVNKSGLSVATDGTVTAAANGDNFATAEQVAKAINDSEKTTTVEKGSDKVSVTGTTTGTKTNYVVDLSNAAKSSLDKADSALQSWTAQVNGANAKVVNQTNNTVNFVNGTNTIVKADANGNISVSTADNVTFNTVNASSFNAGNISIGTNGINAGNTTITNVANGINASDAVNVSQLNATNANVTNNTQNITKNAADIQSTKDGLNATNATVAGNTANITNNTNAIANNTAAINKGINFGNGTTDNNFALGDTINVTSDSNIVVNTEDDGVKLSLADNVTVGNVTVNNTFKAGDVTINSTGIDAGNHAITNVANGTQDSDAVNLSQLNATNANVTNNTQNITNNTAAIANNTANISNNTNAIANNTQNITKNAADIQSTKDGLNATNATVAGNTANITNNTNAIANNTAAINKGINFGNGTTDNNFALGSTINVTSDSNIEVSTVADGVKLALASSIAVDNVTVNDTFKAGDVTINSTGIDAGNHTITNVVKGVNATDAVNLSQLNAGKSSVEAGDNVAVTSTSDANGTVYTVNANISTVSNGSDKVTVTSSSTGNHTTNYAVDLSEAAKASLEKADSALQSLTTSADGTKAQTLDKDNSNANFISGSNIRLTPSADGITIATAENVTFTNVNTTNFKAGDVTINSTGIDAGNHTITNVANGTQDSDAVNLSQLNATNANVTNNTQNITNNTAAIANNTANISNNTNAIANNTQNITKNAADIQSTKDGLNATNATVAGNTANITNNTNAIASNTATINKGINFGNGTTANNFALGSTINVTSDSNIEVSTVADGVKLALASSIAVDNLTANNSVKVGNVALTQAGINAGNHAITNVTNGTNATDAVNLSQLNAGKSSVEAGDNVAVTSTSGANGTVYTVNANTSTVSNGSDKITVTQTDAGNHTSNYAVDLSEAAKSSLNKADSALQSWTAQVNGADAKVVNQTNNTVNFVNGTNTIVKADANGNISVSTADNVTFNTVNASTFNAGNVSISNSGINAGNTTITNVANGTNASDAVNLSQLNATNANVTNNTNNIANNTKNITNVTNLVNQGFNIGADNGTDDNVKLGEKVDFNGDGNIVTTVTNNAIAFALSNTLNLTDAGSVTMGDTVVNGSGMIINNGSTNNQTVSLTKDGLNNGGNTITNVANGSNATDAVNLSQLNAGKSSVEAGDNVAVTSTSDANGTVYTVNANTSTVSNGSDKITVTQTDAGNHTSNYAVDLSDATKASLDKADNALQSWTAQVNGADAKVVNQTNNTVNFVNGTNTIVKADANGNISVSTADNVTFNTVNASSFNAGNISIGTNGINAGNTTITNVANGTNASDAVNVSQLNATNANVTNNTQNITKNAADIQSTKDGLNATNATVAGNTANITNNTNAIANNTAEINKGINFGNGTTDNNFALGDTINVTSDSNIVVNTEDDGVKLSLADNVTVGNVTVNNTFKAGDVTINSTGIDAGNHAITNVANGTQDSDAVNLSQLNATNANVTNNTQNITNNTAAIANNTANISNNTNAIANNTQNITKNAADIQSTKDGLNATNATVAGNTANITNNTNAIANNTAAINKGINFGNGTTANNFALGSTINVTSDSNIEVSTVADGVKLALASSIAVNNVTVNDTFKAGDVTINSTGIDAGNHTITNVVKGVNATDAVNLSQLNAGKSSVEAGDNVAVTSTSDANGTVYTVNANISTVSNGSDKVTVTSSSTGNHTTNYAVDLSEAAKASLEKADSALQSLTTSADGTKAQTLDKDNSNANFISGSNIRLTPSADGITIATAENVTFTNVNTTNFKAGDVTINSTGIDAGNHTITNVAAGTNKTDAVNLGQLEQFIGDNSYNWNLSDGTNNSAVADNSTVAIEGSANGDSANTSGIVTMLDGTNVSVDLSDKAKESLDKADSALQSWTAQVNGTDAKVVNQTNNTVNFVNGTNTIVKADANGNISVSTADNVTFNTVNATTFNAGNVSISNNGINAGNTTITNVANGTNASDAVNVSQLNATNANVTNNTKNITNVTNLVNQGFNIGADNGADDNVKLGEKVDFNGDGNIVTTVTNNAIAFALSNTLNLTDAGSVTMGDTVVNSTGMIINNGSTDNQTVSLTKDGLNNGGNTITGVANGSNATDAVNLSQLNAGKSSVEAGDNVAVTSTSDANGTVYTVNANTSTVSNGSDKITVTQTDAGNHTSNYAVDLSDAAKASLDKADNALQSWTAQVNGADAKVVNQTNNTVNFVNGTNTIVKADANGNISVSTADNVTFNTVNASTFNAGDVSFNTSGINAGNHTITNVANGSNASDAVNVAQLEANTTRYYSVNSTVAGNRNNDGATGINAMAAGANAVASGDNATAIGQGTKANSAAAIAIGNNANATSSRNDSVIAIGNNAQSTGSYSIAVGTNSVANHTWSMAMGISAKAIDDYATALGSSAQATSQWTTALGAGANATGSAATAVGSNTTATAGGATVVGYNSSVTGANTTALGNNINVDTEGSVVLGNGSTAASATTETTATVNNLTYSGFAGADNVATGDYVSVGSVGEERQIKNVAAGNVSATSTDAINGSQLYATQNVIGNVANSVVNNFGGNATVDQNGNITFTDIGGTGANTIHDAIQNVSNVANMGWNVQANGDTATKVAPGNTVQFINGQNIEIDRDGTNITVATADNVTFTNVNTTALTAGPVTINSTGIDAGNHTITNVAAGTNATDAVNLAQLESYVGDNSYNWNLSDGTNNNAVADNSTVTITGSANGDGANTSGIVTELNGTNVSVDLSNKTKADIQQGVDANTTVNTKGITFAADSGTATERKLGETLAINGDGDLINTTVSAGKVEVAASDKLKGAVNNATTALQSWTAQVNGTDAKVVDQTNNTVNFVDGSNINITNNNGTIKVATTDNVTFNTVNASTFNAGGVSISNSGINAGNTTITNVANGTQDSDAVNLSQLNATNANVTNNTNNIANNTANITNNTNAIASNTVAINKGINFGNGTTANNFALGSTINVTSDSNIVVNTTNAGVQLGLADNIAVDNVTVNNTFKAGDVTINNNGIDAGNHAITNVTNGTNATDAVNVSQLNASKTSIVEGNNVNVTAKTDTNGTVYTVNANTSTVSNGSDKITVTQTDAGNHTSNYAVDLSDAAKASLDKADSALQSLTTSADGAKAQTLDKDNSNANFISGSNIRLTPSADGITIATAENVTFTNVNTTNFKAGDVTINSTGIDAGNHTITNVAKGVNATDAVNLAQLESYVGDNSYNWNLSDGTNNNAVADNSTVTITGSANGDSANTSGIVTELNGTNVSVDLSNKTKADIQQGVDANTTVNTKGITFAADSGTATERKLGETLAINGDGDLINTTVSAGKVEVAASDKLKDAVNNATTALQSWTAQVNGADAKVVNQTNNTVNFVNGTNTIVKADANGNISVSTADNVTFNTVNASTFNAGGVSISNSGINAGNTTITNVANGTNASDAVNLSQLNATNANVTNNTNNIANNTKNITNVTNLVNQGFNIGADNGTDDNVKLGEKVDFNGDGNIVTTVTNNAIAFALSNTLNLTDAGSVTMGDTVVNGSGMIINNGSTNNQTVSLTKDGLNNGGNTITNVANGSNATDAVNLSQLNAGKSSVEAGDNVAVTSTSDANGTVYTVNANTSTVSNGSDKITVTQTDAGNHTSNYAVDLSDATKASLDKADNALQSWTAQVNGADAKVVNQTNNTVNFVNGTNTIVKADANGNISVSTADNVTFNTVNASTFNAGNVSISNSGINAGDTTITNVAAGNVSATSTDAINGSQLYATQNVIGNVANSVVNNFGGNATVDQNGNITFTDIGGTGANTIHDAIQNVSNVANMGWNVQANGDTATKVVPGGTVQFINGQNIEISRNGTNITVATADNVTFNNVNTTTLTAGPVTINNSGIDAGATQIKNVAAGTEDTDAVNYKQLKDAVSNSSTTWNLTDNNDTANSTTVGNDSTVSFNNGTNTVAVVNGTNVSYSLADNIALTNNGSVTVGNTMVDNTGISVGDNVTVTNTGFVAGNVTVKQDGINAGGNKITGVADGDISANSTDAVNGGQLYNVIQNATAGVKTEVEAGKNIVVTNSTGANGQTVYTVETAKEVDFDKVTVGNVTINKDTNKVSGIANGDISATSSDAINGSQLYTANQNVADHLGGGSKVDENGNVTAPTYTVVTNPSTNATTTANNVGDAINGLNTAISKPLTFAADSGSNSEMRLGSTVSIKGGVSDSTKLSDNNIGVVSDGKGNLTVKLAKDISGLNSVTTGDTTMNSEGITIKNGAAGSSVSLTKNGLNNGGNRITNVAPGEVSQDSTDAVNGSQLHATNQQVVRNAQAINQVANHVNKVDRNLRAGIAGAMAAGGLYHATLPGKSMVAAGVGTYRGESAIAVGYSRLSDNGKLGVKFSVNGNTRGDTGAAASVGYQW